MADTKETIFCPTCGKKMVKIFMQDVAINVDVCLDGCGGILFDNRELEKCDEAHENASEVLEAIEGKEFEEVDTSKSIECPVCGAVMMKMGAGSGNVELDNCGLCGAKFLNNGELQKIRNGEKDTVNDQVLEMLDIALEQHIDNVTYGLKPKKSSPRRQFVEDLVRKIMFK